MWIIDDRSNNLHKWSAVIARVLFLRLQLEEDVEERVLRTFSMLTTVYSNLSQQKKKSLEKLFHVQVTAVHSNKKITLWIFNLSLLTLESFFALTNSFFIAWSMLKFVLLMNILVRKHNLHLLDLKEFTSWISLCCQLSHAFELSDDVEWEKAQ